MDRLFSERWILRLENWPMGVYVQAYLLTQYSSAVVAQDMQVCIDLALVSQQLKIHIERELQLIQCGSVLVGCFDDINPFVLWQKNHIFDMCELSPYVTQNVYTWEVFDSTTHYLYLWPQE